jgi:hypothetical protein
MRRDAVLDGRSMGQIDGGVIATQRRDRSNFFLTEFYFAG